MARLIDDFGDDEPDSVISLTEQRKAYRVQRELLATLHEDGEARTRHEDRSATRKLFDSAQPFVIGILLGALATFSALSSRLSTLEAVQAAQSTAIAELRKSAEDTRSTSQEILIELRSTEHTLNARH